VQFHILRHHGGRVLEGVSLPASLLDICLKTGNLGCLTVDQSCSLGGHVSASNHVSTSADNFSIASDDLVVDVLLL
jgi:hypothetical protein